VGYIIQDIPTAECLASRVKRHTPPPNPGHPFSGALMRYENQTRATRRCMVS